MTTDFSNYLQMLGSKLLQFKVSSIAVFFLFFVQTDLVNFDADLRKDEEQQVHVKSANLRKEAVLVSVADLKHHSDTDTADAAAHEKDAVTGWE